MFHFDENTWSFFLASKFTIFFFRNELLNISLRHFQNVNGFHVLAIQRNFKVLAFYSWFQTHCSTLLWKNICLSGEDDVSVLVFQILVPLGVTFSFVCGNQWNRHKRRKRKCVNLSLVNLSSYLCILSTSLQLLLPKEDHVVRLTREVGGSTLCESTQKKHCEV